VGRYLLKQILHDWDGDERVAILEKVKKAILKREGSKALVVEFRAPRRRGRVAPAI